MRTQKPKATMSFVQYRKAMLTEMAQLANGRDETKIIRFRNNDVPSFLDRLDAYEDASLEANLMVK